MVGRFEANGPKLCDPTNPRDVALQEPSVHAFDSRSGAVAYQQSGGASFGPTSVAGQMTFNCSALRAELDVRDANAGTTLVAVSLPVPCWSGVATVGSAVVLGAGASFSDKGSGVMVLTPGGAPPSVPGS